MFGLVECGLEGLSHGFRKFLHNAYHFIQHRCPMGVHSIDDQLVLQPDAYADIARSLAPQCQNNKGAGNPIAILINARTLVPHP